MSVIRLTLLLSMLCFSGYSTAQKYPENDPMCRNNQFNCTYEPVPWKGTIEIIPDPNTTEICNKLTGKVDPGVVACSTSYNNRQLCIIYVKPKTTMALIGHEIRHCAEGAWH